MKQPYFKKLNARLIAAFMLLLGAALIIHSCKKESKLTQADSNITDPDVLAAQAWYNTNYPALGGANSTVLYSTNGANTKPATQSNPTQQAASDWSKVLSPYWTKAAAFTSKKGLNIVEAPALNKSDMAFARSLPPDLAKYNFGQSGSLTSMLIIKQGKQYAAYAMTIMGDSSYLKGDYSKLSNNTYRHRDKDFTGWVLYHQLNGTFVNGWRYINGQVTSAVYYHAPQATSAQVTLTQGVQRAGAGIIRVLQTTCDYTAVYQIFALCSYANSDTQQLYPSDCTYRAQYMGVYSVCTTINVSDGGDGSPSTPPQPPPCVPGDGSTPPATTNPAAAKMQTTPVLRANGQRVLVAQPTDPPPTDPTDPNGEITPPILCPVVPTPVDTVKKDTVKDPCTQVNILANSAPFKGMMGILQGSTSNNYESGYTYIANADGTYTVSVFTGQPNTNSIAVSFLSPGDGFLHAHYIGGYPTFSPADIQQLYQIMQQGGMKNVSTFTAGVVTASGTSYLIKISDPTKFAAFGAANLGSNNFNGFENNYIASQGIYNSNGNTTSYELALLSVLQNSGLTLFKGDSSFSSWTPIIKQNNQVATTNCNN